MYDEEQIKSALLALPSWSGSTDRLQRTVLADPGTTGRLRAEVARLAAEGDHHPVVEDVEGGTRFVLWTQAAGGVTGRDTQLAARIDAVAAGVSKDVAR